MKYFSIRHSSITARLTMYSGIAAVGLAFAATTDAFSPTPKNLGNGLAQVVARDLALKRGNKVNVPGTGSAVDLGNRAIRDKQGRILVRIMLKSPAYRQSAIAVKGVQKVAEDMKYKTGVIEAFVPAAQVATVARRPGVLSVVLSVKPFLDVGLVTSHGVVQHRVDQITNQNVSPVTGITGDGITVGALSDSFDSATTDLCGAPKATNAAADVVSGDLPGAGNPNNSTPVLVLHDGATDDTDEGRGMLQIIHDMAPGANLAFATAGPGQVGFGNNIRQLADTVANGGAGAQVIVDDVIYLDESMFEDGIVARAVDDVAAQGVAYFSSAGNRPATQAYFSDFRPVANDANALTNTNINLTGVPPNLYAGGFHDFNPASGLAGQDIAQTVNISTAIFSFQWDDPFDVNPVSLGAQIPTTPPSPGPGSTTGTGEFEFTFVNDTVNKRVQIEVVGTAPTPNYDAIVKVVNPDDTTLTDQDTGLEETVLIFLPQTGTYKVRVRQFNATPASSGSFTYTVHEASGTPLLSTDFNIMFFRTNGAFIGAVGEDNLNTNRPVELAQVTNGQAGGTGQVQVVIARSNVPPAGPQATKVRYVTFTSGTPQEYFTYNQTPGSYGHNCAAGANGVAAYAFFPPNIPEAFTSPGHGYIAFDKNNNRLAQPLFRLKPDIAAMDGANNTFFPCGAGQDSAQDTDTFPNFFGTSAAAPHAAAIAALVLDAKGGPGSVTPAQMRTMLQRSAFPHDLDPYLARVTARTGNSKLTITALGDTGSTSNITSTIDPNAFDVAYTGPDSLTQVVFNPGGTAATAGNTTEPTDTTSGFTSTPGIIFDNRAPNTGFPFTLGALRGVSSGDISSSLSNQAPPPAIAGNHFFTLTVDIASDALIGGEGFGFGIDRDEADAFGPAGSVGGNSADLLGANVLIPQGTLALGGMTISGQTSTGGVFSGVFVNRIGSGYSVLDGFGFINAQSAVNQPLP